MTNRARTLLAILTFTAFTLFTIALSAATADTVHAQSSSAQCPTDNGPHTPTAAECAAGWKWAAPNSPITSRPISLTPTSDGKLVYGVCYLSGAVFAGRSYPDPITCSPGVVCPTYCHDASSISSITLRSWCSSYAALPTPAGYTKPNLVGICGK